MAIRVIDTIKPKNNADFAIVEDGDVKGGFRTVADATARDAITAAHRTIGMWVVTQDDGKKWQLGNDLTTWTEFTGGGGGTLAGDVTGPSGSNTLTSIQTVPINDPATANNGDALKVSAVNWVTEDGMGAIGWDGTYIWATNWQPRLFKIDPVTRTIVSQHDLTTYGINHAADLIRATPTRVVLVCGTSSRDVSIIRSSDGAEVGRVDWGGDPGSVGSALVIGDNLYLTERVFPALAVNIYRFSIAAIEASYPTPLTIGGALASQTLTGTAGVLGLAFDGTYVFASRSDSLWRLDPTTLAEVDSYTFGVGEDCNDVIYAFGSIWTPATTGFVYRFDPATFPGGGSRTAIASTHTSATWIVADATHIWVPDWDTNASVYRFSTGLGTEAQTQTILTEPGDENGYIVATDTEVWTAIDWSAALGTGWMALRRFTTGVTATYAGQFANYRVIGYGASGATLASLDNPGGAADDLARWNGANWVRFPMGSAGQFLGVQSGEPNTVAWRYVPMSDVTNPGGAAGDIPTWNGAVWTSLTVGPEGYVLKVTGGAPSWQPSVAAGIGDNGRAMRAVAWKKASAFGGRENSFTGPEESGAFTYNASTSLSMSTGTGTVAALYAMALLGPNLYFTGSTGGNDGRLYRLNIATRAATLVSGANFSVTGQLSGTSSHGAGSISADNACDMIAHRDYVNGDTLAALTPKGLFLVYPTAYSGSYPATLFRGKPAAADGFLGGRVVSVDVDASNGVHMGLVIATAPNESLVYFADWNNNLGATFPSQGALGTTPQAICVDADNKVWIVDRANGDIRKCSVNPAAAALTVDATYNVANAQDIIWNGRHIVVLSVGVTNALTLLNPSDGSVALQRTSPISPAAGTMWTFNSVAVGGNGAPRLWWDGEAIWAYSNGTSDVMRVDPDTLYPLSFSAAGSTSNGFCAISAGVSFYTSPSAYTMNSVTADLNGNASFHSIWRLDTPLQPAQGGTGLTALGANGTVLTSSGTTVSWAAPTAAPVNTGNNGQRFIGSAGQRRATAQHRFPMFGMSSTTTVSAMAWTGDDLVTCEAGFVRTYNIGSGIAGPTYDALSGISITPTHIVYGGAATRSGLGVPCLWIGGTGGLAKLTYNSGTIALQGSAYTTSMAVGGLIYDGNYLWILNSNQNCISRVDNPNQSATGPTVTLNWTANGSLTTNGSVTQRMTWDGRYLWTISTTDSKLYKIDTLATNTVTTFTLAGNPTGICFDGRWLWVPIGGTMYRLDPTQTSPVTSPTTYPMSTGSPTGDVQLAAVTHMIPDGKWLWLMNSSVGSGTLPSVVKFDPDTGYQISAHQGTDSPQCGIAVGNSDAGGFAVIGTASAIYYYSDWQPMSVGPLRLMGPIYENVTRVATTPYTIGASGATIGGVYVVDVSGGCAITLPVIGTNNYAVSGMMITIKNNSDTNITVQAGSGEAAEWGSAPATTTINIGTFKKFMVYRDGINPPKWLVVG